MQYINRSFSLMFIVDAVQILTSTVIECYRSNMKESAFKFATILMKSDYRQQVNI